MGDAFADGTAAAMREAQLARRAAAGDRDAFGVLVERHQGMIYRVCKRYLASEAEDLAQETFVRALVERERYDPRYPLGPWLVTVARRLCIDRIRRRKPEAGSHEAALQAVSRDAGGERTAAWREELELVNQILQTLPDGQREALWLYHADGLAYRDIAQALEVPIGTVMSWLHRARVRLSTARHDASTGSGETPPVVHERKQAAR
jgi:RNA polymerase sigma-70 factor, ECF subfamily